MWQKVLVMLLLLLVRRTDSQICSKINFSSDGFHLDDLVKQGVTSTTWSQDSTNPIIIGSSKKQDYIYIMLSDDNGSLDEKDFKLVYDNRKYANSSFTLDKSKKYNQNVFEYAIRIIYHCNNYGGALINYKLEVTVPNCGSAYVHWKKLCGNPT